MKRGFSHGANDDLGYKAIADAATKDTSSRPFSHEREIQRRDGIVESLNADKPYDRFIQEQFAGDQLGADAATGFLVAGPDAIGKSPDVNLTLAQR